MQLMLNILCDPQEVKQWESWYYSVLLLIREGLHDFSTI